LFFFQHILLWLFALPIGHGHLGVACVPPVVLSHLVCPPRAQIRQDGVSSFHAPEATGVLCFVRLCFFLLPENTAPSLSGFSFDIAHSPATLNVHPAVRAPPRRRHYLDPTFFLSSWFLHHRFTVVSSWPMVFFHQTSALCL